MARSEAPGLALRSYDETSHFEGVTNDVLDLYRRITGKELDLKDKDPSKATQQQ